MRRQYCDECEEHVVCGCKILNCPIAEPEGEEHREAIEFHSIEYMRDYDQSDLVSLEDEEIQELTDEYNEMESDE